MKSVIVVFTRKLLFCYDDERVVNYILSIILPSLQIDYFFLLFYGMFVFPAEFFVSCVVRLFWAMSPNFTGLSVVFCVFSAM
jgi:hypothetical protein